jgi:hypothetical protein
MWWWSNYGPAPWWFFGPMMMFFPVVVCMVAMFFMMRRGKHRSGAEAGPIGPRFSPARWPAERLAASKNIETSRCGVSMRSRESLRSSSATCALPRTRQSSTSSSPSAALGTHKPDFVAFGHSHATTTSAAAVPRSCARMSQRTYRTASVRS